MPKKDPRIPLCDFEFIELSTSVSFIPCFGYSIVVLRFKLRFHVPLDSCSAVLA